MTAEEKGSARREVLRDDPLYPLNKTLANINMDGVNQWGRTKDIVMVGDGNSTLDDLLREARAIAGPGRQTRPRDRRKASTTARTTSSSPSRACPRSTRTRASDYIGKTAEYSKQKRDEYTANDYHKVSDEVKPDWDLTGAVEDAQLLFVIGYRVAEARTFPEWKPGTEFKAKRDAMMKAR